jgi:hypothetical protein
MKIVTKLILLVCTALTALAFASCNAIADTSGLIQSPETVWIRLVPSVAVGGKATLVLDFSKPVDGLTNDTSSADLAALFTFKNGEGMSGAEAITAAGITKDSEAVYTLTVGSVPDVEKGIVLVTINKQGIAPPTRAWSVDGEIVPDEPTLTSAPSIALTPGHEQLGYTITASDPAADSYDVYWIAGSETDGATIKAGGTQIPNSPLTGTISPLSNWQIYSVIVRAHKADYADCDSESASEMPMEPLANAERRFVKVGGNGTSWEDASGNIQAMMDELEQAAGGEVWVAAGKYTPGSTRESTFALKNNVTVYGGFPAGITSDTALNIAMHDRSARFNTVGIISDASCETILSGDIGGTDTYADNYGFITGNNDDNVYHVVTVPPGTLASAVLDGFTVKGGYANSDDHSSGSGGGGGIFSNATGESTRSSPTFVNLTITGNVANYGYNGYSGKGQGGGIYNNYSSPTLTNVTIAGNQAGTGQVGSNGGSGIYNRYSAPVLTNVVIAGNRTGGCGGGIYNGNSSPILTNVVITGNLATEYYYGGGGGGIVIADSSPTLTNVTIAGNLTYAGGGIDSVGSTVAIRNSIVWGNATWGGPSPNVKGSATWSNSLVGGSIWDWGTSADCLASENDPFEGWLTPNTWSDWNGNGNFVTTTAGNYRLKAGSVAINMGGNIPSAPANWNDAVALHPDLGTWADFWTALTDLDGTARIKGGTIDMGAYEKQ